MYVKGNITVVSIVSNGQVKELKMNILKWLRVLGHIMIKV